VDNGHTHPAYEHSIDRITGLIDRLVTTVQTLAEVQLRAAEAQQRTDEKARALRVEVDERIKALIELQRHSDDRLNAMIDYFQRHLDEHGRQQ
jgi:glutamine synthetase type III